MTIKHKNLMLPTGANVINILKRAVRARSTTWNYMVTWKDVAGTGVHLAVVDWLPTGAVWVK